MRKKFRKVRIAIFCHIYENTCNNTDSDFYSGQRHHGNYKKVKKKKVREKEFSDFFIAVGCLNH